MPNGHLKSNFKHPKRDVEIATLRQRCLVVERWPAMMPPSDIGLSYRVVVDLEQPSCSYAPLHSPGARALRNGCPVDTAPEQPPLKERPTPAAPLGANYLTTRRFAMPPTRQDQTLTTIRSREYPIARLTVSYDSLSLPR